VAWLKNAKADTILSHMKDMRNICVKRGFLLETAEVDGQFEPLRGELAAMGVTLNKCSREEHVPVAERRIRTLKEHCRSICCSLLHGKLPRMLVVQMVSTCNFWLKVHPPTDGISRSINPHELITGVKIDCNKHIGADFGEHTQTHEEHDSSMKSRTTAAIATKPTGNAQGGHWFCSLTAGRMIDRRQWTSSPMPTDVIEHAETLARNNSTGMNFTNMRNEAVHDVDDEDDSDDESDGDSDHATDEEESDADEDDYDDFIAGVEMHNEDPPDPPDEGGDENQQNQAEDEEEAEENDEEDDDEIYENGPDNNDDDAGEEMEAEPTVIPSPLKKLTDCNGKMPAIVESRTRQKAQNTSETLVTAVTEEQEIPEKTASKKQRKRNRELQKQMLKREEEEQRKRLRNKSKNKKRRLKIKEKRKIRNETRDEPEELNEFGDLHDRLRAAQKPGVSFRNDSCSSKGLTPDFEATALTQCDLKRGLKEFGDDGITALRKEVEQLHMRKVAKPVDSSRLSREEKRASLRHLMFLTRKRCGRVKARGCTDGRKQRETTKKEDASAPTVAIEAVMLSAVIDAVEERDVATADMPGAFMQGDIDEVAHVKFEGETAEMLVKLDPALHRKFVKDENGKTVLCVELLKALCGALKAALLFWKLLSSKLVSWGFEINPCDWCVANKTTDGKQCTVQWHVDGLKTSYVDSAAVRTVIRMIDEEFGKEAPITVARGKVHDCLGMTLDCSRKGKAHIKMVDSIEKMLVDLPEEFDGEAPTPAANHLFNTDENSPKVDEERAHYFHKHVAKTLLTCKQARPDLQTAVAFLCERVKECQEDDHKKSK
jgi:hypothetical protein